MLVSCSTNSISRDLTAAVLVFCEQKSWRSS